MNAASRVCVALAASAFLAACGAGGSSVPSSAGAAVQARKARAVFTIEVPREHRKHGRSGRYVAPTTASLVIILDGPTHVSGTVSLTPGSPNCSSTLQGTACTFVFSLAPGAYAADLEALDAQSKPLSAASGAAFTVTAGAANKIGLTLSGIPSQILVTPASGSSLINVAGGIDLIGQGGHPMLVQALDADGNTIVGPGAPSFEVASTGALSLAVTQPSAASPNAFVVTPPSAFSGSAGVLKVTAVYPAGQTNACAVGGAVCTATVSLAMHELVAIMEGNSVNVYESGRSTALASVTAGISNPQAIAFDSAGDLIVANCMASCGSGSIDLLTVYAAPYDGTPVAISNGVGAPQELAFNAAGDLFVAQCPSCRTGGTDNVTEYAPPFTGASAPIATITSNIANPSAMAFDPSGNLYVASDDTDSVSEYPQPFPSASPVSTISSGVSAPVAIAVDSGYELYVANTGTGNGTVTLYKPGSTTVAATITNTIDNPVALAVDSSGDLFVANQSGNAVTEYRAPLSNLSSPALDLTVGQANSLYLDGAANLFTTSRNGATLLEYGSPYAAAPSSIDTGGTPQAMAVLP